MAKWLWIPIAIAAFFLLKGRLPNLVEQSFPHAERNDSIVGRWDGIGNTDFIRFTQDGYFRSDISGAKCEGTYCALEGGGLEIVVSCRTKDPRTNKERVVKSVVEYKYTLQGDILKLRLDNLWATFKKGTATPDESPPVAPPGLIPTAVPVAPAELRTLPKSAPPLPVAPKKDGIKA